MLLSHSVGEVVPHLSGSGELFQSDYLIHFVFSEMKYNFSQSIKNVLQNGKAIKTHTFTFL